MKIGHRPPWICIIATVASAAIAPVDVSAQITNPMRLDRHGDPLPPGALARLGTKRMSHRQGVSFVQYTPDGKELISGSHNDFLGYWDVAVGDRWLELRTKQGGFAFALSKNGQTFACPGEKGTILVWDLATGEKLAVLSGHHEDISALALSADGTMLASAGDINRVGIWNVARSRPERELVGHAGKVRSLSFSPDGKTLASGGDDGNLRLWSVDSGAQRQVLKMPSAIRCVVISPSGQLLACAAEKGFFVRNIAKGQVAWHNAELDNATAVAFSADENLIAMGREECIHLHQVSTGKSLALLKGHLHTVSHLDFSPEGKTLASGSADYSVRLWDIASGKQRFPEYVNFGRHMEASFLTDGKTLLVSRKINSYHLTNDMISFWNPEHGIQLHQLKLISIFLGQEFLSADGKILVRLKENDQVRVSEVPSGKILFQYQCKLDLHKHFALSPDGRWLGEAKVDGSLNVQQPWFISFGVRDLRTGKVVVEKTHQVNSPLVFLNRQLSFSGNSRILRFSGETHERYQFDRETGQIIPASKTSYLTEARSRDEKLAIVAVPEDEDAPPVKKGDQVKEEYLIMEAIPDGEATETIKPSPIGRFSFPGGLWRTHHFLPSNRILATGSGSTIHLWSIPNGKEIGSFILPAKERTKTWRELNEHGVNSLACSGDGRLLVSTHFNGTGLVWDLTPFHAKARLGISVDEATWERNWSNLIDMDAAKAWQSIWTMAEHPELSMKLLEGRLKPEIVPQEKEAARMIRDLGSANFKVRQQALKEIRGHGRRIAHFLRKALTQKLDLEIELRLRQQLEELAKPELFTPERLRQWRAMAVLEQINTPAARQLLQRLAEGAPEAWLTKQAVDSARRVSGQK